ncbi:MAG: hypothetical protein KJO06_08540 [Gemmatimonadetes bacterium]|nr:hypothetical protein [Gemmatimonadota bacterium]
MIIAIVIALGFIVLLVAPTMHRRSIQKSRAEAAAKKVERAASFRREQSTEEHVAINAAEAVQARDALMLRGVRSEVVADDDGVVLLASEDDRQAVTAAFAALR